MSEMRAVVFGANGGIGAALVEELRQSDRFAEIHAGGRQAPLTGSLTVQPFAFDLTNETSIKLAAETIGASGPVDLIIVATGMLHNGSPLMPEKSWRAIDPTAMASVFAVNTIGPALIAKHFLPRLHPDKRAIFAALSARVGSITDNALGGWHSYRASKAALNMLVRNFAIEFKVRNPQGIIVTLHPGTVETSLSAPFKRNVSPEKLFSPQQSAAHLLAVLDGLEPNHSGGLYAWDRQQIAF
jgi:NAD(P)-dependent dehydrogenase (short-subunit alcohol dehydrogenase family)